MPRINFEESALIALASTLRSRGHIVADIGCPELDPSDPLNIDARFEIDGKVWGVEHCRIVYDPRMIPAHIYADEQLRPEGTKFAEAHGVQISVGFYPPRWQPNERPPTNFYKSILDRIATAVFSKSKDIDDKCQIWVEDGQPEFILNLFTSDNPFIGKQLADGLREPLLKKRSRQFLPAKTEGLPLILLLDQVVDPSSKMHPQWLFSEDTLRSVLHEVFPEMLPVQEVWLRCLDGNCRSIIPPDKNPVVDRFGYLRQTIESSSTRNS